MKKRITAVAVALSLSLTGEGFSTEGKSHYKVRYVKYFNNAPAFAKSSGTGAIKGRVLYVGKRKLKNRRKLITKDKEVCGRGYKIDEVYVISKEGGVKNAVVFLTGVSKPGKGKVTMAQERCEFHPRVLSLDSGGVLEIVNKDPVKHEANGVQDFETIFQLAQPKKGMVDRVTLDKPGVVEVTCNIHGWMKGWVVVVDSPFHDVTDREGRFALKGVPAGTHTLRLWHEGFGEKKLKVKVEEGKVTEVIFELR
jgi:plastocyanin